MTTLDISAAATAFTLSYARAMAIASSSDSNNSSLTPVTAAALAAHYSNTTASTFGQQKRFSSFEETTKSITGHLASFEQHGLGLDIKLSSHRVEPVIETSAVCWITWEIKPLSGSGFEGWKWENVYVYRRGVQGEEKKTIGAMGSDDGWDKPEGCWEYIVTDNEIAGILARVPKFFEHGV
ncbi:putative rho protein [Favolaschia claudopus]|uniref:Rho protein n=1 Tax=Favolaschia claudopus TaxID=2862362 RepID=A0AAW0AAD6_9AGAR